MSLDNLRHAQYSNIGVQVDDPNSLYPEICLAPDGAFITRTGTLLFYPVQDQTNAQILALNPALHPRRLVRATELQDSVFVSNAVRWKPWNNRAVIATLDTDVTATGTAETIVFQKLMPSWLFRDGDTFSLWLSLGKNNTVENTTITIRLGTTGTTADTILSQFAPLTAANVSAGLILEYSRVTATTVEKCGNGANNSSFAGQSTAALNTPVAGLPNMSNNNFYLSVGLNQNAPGAEIATLRRARIELISSGS